MPTWDEAADWYVQKVVDSEAGFNQLASDVVFAMLGGVAELKVLDLGCGEGHFARRLARAGAQVVATDPTAKLIAVAERREAEEPLGITYHCGDLESLVRLDPGPFDLAVALLVLHHVGGLSSTLDALYGALRPGGRLAELVPHPSADHRGAAWSMADHEVRRQIGHYTVEGFWREEMGDGATLTTIRQIGWHHRTVASWVNALVDAGFAVEHLEEPTGASIGRADGGGPWRSIPRFLGILARRSVVTEREAPIGCQS